MICEKCSYDMPAECCVIGNFWDCPRCKDATDFSGIDRTVHPEKFANHKRAVLQSDGSLEWIEINTKMLTGKKVPLEFHYTFECKVTNFIHDEIEYTVPADVPEILVECYLAEQARIRDGILKSFLIEDIGNKWSVDSEAPLREWKNHHLGTWHK